MPPRFARSSVQIATPKTARNKNRKRNPDAFSVASHSVPAKGSGRQNRLGELLDDGPKQKRRRIAKQGDEEDGVEEEVPAPHKRSATKDDGIEEGSDSEGNEWTLGGLREDDEDSDLDSDEAFGESDEERFAGFTFRGSSSGKGRKPEKRRVAHIADEGADDGIDLDEAESQDEDDNDDFGDEGVDLATILDDEDEEMLGGKDSTAQDLGEESASDDEEADSVSSSDYSQDHEDDDGADDERIARMRDRLDALDSSNQQLIPQPQVQQQPTLTVDDLLAGLDPAARKQFAAPLKARKKSERPQTLTAPLPPRQQQRIDREVATKKAKEQLDRWRDTVIQNRRAEFLSFPLTDPDRGEPLGKDKFTHDDAPRGELEESIKKIMEESGLVSQPGQNVEGDEEDALIQAEGLAEKNMPVEEVMRRRAELRRTRELLFREEIKAKRISKIKSKSYRRVHRKERERIAERQKEGLEPGDLGEDEKEVADRKRAEERMSTKHRDSKWAKSLKATNRTVWDTGAQDSVNEQARRKEELRRRIAGDEVADDNESEVSSAGESVDSEDGDGSGRLRQLDRIQGDAGKEGKGLGEMKFMRAADARRRKQNDEDIERLRREMAVEDGDEQETHDEAVEDQGLGRAIFGPKSRENEVAEKTKRPELEEGDVSDDDRDDEEEVKVVVESSKQPGKKQSNGGAKKADVNGPRSGIPDRRDVSERISSTSETNWLAAPLSGSKKDRRRAAESNSNVYIDTTTQALNKDLPNGVDLAKASSIADSLAKAKSAASKTVQGWTGAADTGYDLDSNLDLDLENNANNNIDLETINPVLSKQQETASYQQRAFAGDDVKAAFDAEKAEAAVSEDEKEVSNHLPGWGSWTGEGLSKSVRKANNRQRHNPIYKTKLPGVAAEARKDVRLENVLISEKQDRKGKKYKADILPHDFEKKEQYERSLRVPMGPEWVTKETFQRNTRPRVVIKPGVVVGAMERPLL